MPEQRHKISESVIFEKTEENLTNESLENIQKYLLSQIKILLDCNKEEYKYTYCGAKNMLISDKNKNSRFDRIYVKNYDEKILVYMRK